MTVGPMTGGRTTRRLVLRTPVGPFLLEGDAEGLTGVGLPGDPETERAAFGAPTARPSGAAGAVLAMAASQLEEYLSGARTAFTLPLCPRGTPFQLSVWHALADIPYGQTVTYGELARRVGRPGAARAVGQANGANPLPVVLPCHRVVASGGRLGGYGGGVALKRRLLELEGADVARC